MNEVLKAVPWGAIWAAMAPIILVMIWPVLRELAGKIRDERMRAFVLDLVAAAEKQFGSGQGEAKRNYVTQQAEELGLEITRPQIEAAVRKLDLEKTKGMTDQTVCPTGS